MKRIPDKRLTKYQIRNMMAAMFYCIVLAGSVGENAVDEFKGDIDG